MATLYKKSVTLVLSGYNFSMKTPQEKEEDFKSIKKEARKLFLILFGFGVAAYLVVNGFSILS